MPTTIKLKNGSGAPTAGDLVQGEPALDLTNKRLYTEDAGGNVIEVGTSPSTIDINAGSIDGVTLGTNSAVTSAVITTADINGGTVDGITSLTVNGNVSVDGGTIKLDGNYPTGTNNVALGNGALSSGSLSGGSNTAVGYQALFSNTTGSENVAVGKATLYSNTTGIYNTAVGEGAMFATTTGGYNTALGMNALNQTTTASNNTGVGYYALRNNTTGTRNVAVGYAALDANTSGSENVAIGRDAGTANTTSGQNTFIGDASGQATTGASNTFVGANSGYTVTTGSKNTILGKYNGNQGGLDIRTSSNNIVLSDGDGNPRLNIDGSGNVNIGVFSATGSDRGIQVDRANIPFQKHSVSSVGTANMLGFFNPNGQVGGIQTSGSSTSFNTSSDYRLKENVTDIIDGIDRLKQLPVHRFNFIADPDTTVDGFLAHEAQAVVPEAITGTKDEVDEDGNPKYQGIDQSKLVPLLTAALKEAITEIESLKERVATLESN